MDIFELISEVIRYFAGGIKGDAASAINFASLCVKRMQHPICKRFSALRIQMASVVIEYYKRILIISVNICLHGI